MKTVAIELHPNAVAEAGAPPRAKARVAAYIELTKPRITFLIVLTSAAGFCLGSRGAVYFAAPGFDSLADLEAASTAIDVGPLRTALVPVATTFDTGDPTGCGDVWGATYFARLLAGDDIAVAMRAAHGAAARNVMFRGASGLTRHLRGELITQ